MEGQSFSYFRIVSKIGQGGMGEVWEATDTKLNRRVALKLLPELFAHDSQRMGRFQREAQVLASLNHPNIAAIYGLEDADGKKALVMELVEGEELSAHIARSPLPMEQAAGLALQIAKALESAHDKGIIHRDLKPANVKITPEGTVKVLDFGLAKAMENDPSSNPDMTQSPTLSMAATQAGIILGTAAYMAPEQARGRTVDRRADIWAFGVVLYEMLTGKKAFEGEDLSMTLASVMTRQPDWEALPDAIPPSIRRLLQRCLEKDPMRRLQSIGEARIILESYIDDPNSVEFSGNAVVGKSGSGPYWKVLAAVGLVCAMLAAVVWFPRSDEPRQVFNIEMALSGKLSLMLGYGSSVVLSPDGTRMAYVLGDGSRPELNRILLRSLDLFEAKEIDGSEGGYHPFFSPDGKWVGFVTRTEMKKVAITGGAPLKLCDVDRSRGASWGPDGMIVFAPNPASGLSSVSAAGGQAQELTSLEEGETSHRWPHFLPDGEHVLFTAMNGPDVQQASLKVVNLASKEQRTIHRGGTQGRYLSSGHLVFWREGTVYAAPFDLGSMELETLPAPAIQEVAGSSEGGAQFDVSQTGTLVSLKGGFSEVPDAPRTLQWFDRSGKSRPASRVEASYLWGLDLSPDGRQLAVGRLVDSALDVWVYDLERDTPSRLTFSDKNDLLPLWSPDGKSIYFASDRGGVYQIYRKPADGSGEEEVIAPSDVAQLPTSISADGRYLLFSRTESGNKPDIWVTALDGSGETKPFFASNFQELFGRFSPDSRWVAYMSDETGETEVYVRPFPGPGGRWQVSTGGGALPIWSADGKKLFYGTGDGPDRALMEVDIAAEGNALRVSNPQVALKLGQRIQEGIYEVSADGDSFLLVQEPEGEAGPLNESRIARLSINWFQELERMLEIGR